MKMINLFSFAGYFLLGVICTSNVALSKLVVEEADDAEQGKLTVFHMTVTAAPEPVPALEHRLWLKPQELKPGNSVVHYLRAIPEGGIEEVWKQLNKQFGDAVDDWYGNEVPLEALPLDKVHTAVDRFESRFEQMLLPGSMCRDCDWGWDAVTLRGPETISYLMPDLQAMRSTARAIALRTRLAIAEHRYVDAIESLRVNYRLGRDVGQQPILISSLVGIAIERITNQNLIDLIAAPDSPNLYWALAEMPTPLVDCRDAVRVEMSLGLRFFPALSDAETSNHSAAEWTRILSESIEDFGAASSGVPPALQDDTLRGLAATGLSLIAYPAAKQRLIASGMAADIVDSMPVGQVIAIDTAREYRRIADEQEKWWYVSFQAAQRNDRRAEAALVGDTTVNFGKIIARLLLPAVNACRDAQMRIQWQHNALLVLEALRMHAAVTGKFPASLDEIQVVPVPDNPITRKPYVYRLEDGMAVLELPASDGMHFAWRFELKLAENSRQ